MSIKSISIGGHSFGGITAILASAKQPESFASCVTLDPWFYPAKFEVDDGKLDVKIPTAAYTTQTFHPSVLKMSTADGDPFNSF